MPEASSDCLPCAAVLDVFPDRTECLLGGPPGVGDGIGWGGLLLYARVLRQWKQQENIASEKIAEDRSISQTQKSR